MSDSRPPRPPASFSLPRTQIDRLDQLAAEHGVPRSRVLEGLIAGPLAAAHKQPVTTAPGSAKSSFLLGFEAGLRRGLFCPGGACPPIAAEDFDLGDIERVLAD